MNKYLFLIISVTSFAVALNSCEHIPESMLVPPVNGVDTILGGDQTCSSDTVYFQNKILPLLISSCAKSNCHDAVSHQDGVQLTSYQLIMATADVEPGNPDGSKLFRVLNETDPDKIMPRPPSNPLSQTEKDLIYKWILQGAKNNACNDCDTTTITWSAAVLPMMNTYCKGCHNPAFLSAGLDLTNHASVQSVAFNGKLVGSIDHLPGFPPMPRGASKLSDCKIIQVKKWVNAGALNN